VVDEDDRTLDLPSHAASRAERCLWLGCQLALVRQDDLYEGEYAADKSQLHQWLAYDRETKRFSITELARSALVSELALTSESRSHTLSVGSDRDVRMLDG
jgi:hypothetical protein